MADLYVSRPGWLLPLECWDSLGWISIFVCLLCMFVFVGFLRQGSSETVIGSGTPALKLPLLSHLPLGV